MSVMVTGMSMIMTHQIHLVGKNGYQSSCKEVSFINQDSRGYEKDIAKRLEWWQRLRDQR